MDGRLRRELDAMTPAERSAWEVAVARRCPSWKRCSAPKCPLDPIYHERIAERGDPRCRAEKPTRLRIVAQCAAEGVETVRYLPAAGLTPREEMGRVAGERTRARWEAMSPEEQEAERARLSRALDLAHRGRF